MNVCIIGAGAAGLACAVELSKLCPKIKITIFEQNDKIGKKLLTTGNGKCNLTHLSLTQNDYISLSAKVPEYISNSDNQSISFFQSLGLMTYSDDEGRVYPVSNQAISVVDALKCVCDNNNVEIKTGISVDEIKRKNEKYCINGEIFDIAVLCLGGKAQVKKYNAQSIVESLGHSFTNIHPMLVKLTTDSKITKDLKGVRANCRLKLFSDNKVVATEDGEVQFSDYTISGICSMQLSSKIVTSNGKNKLSIDFLPDVDENQISKYIVARKKLFANSGTENLLSGLVNKKIGIEILRSVGIKPNRTCGDIKENEFNKMVQLLKSFVFNITGVSDFNDAQVMLGGIKLTEINIDTLESRINKNLYFAGEILDVTGYCGGYNLNWAWTSGRRVAKSISRNSYVKNK